MSAWEELSQHYQSVKDRSLLSLFEDTTRFETFSVSTCDMVFDFSKVNIDSNAMSLLLKLANEAELERKRDLMFSGALINETENRAVLHTALRNLSSDEIYVNGVGVMDEINQTRARMVQFAQDIRTGQQLGSTGKKITDVVNIGIGGSDLGPVMGTEALRPYQDGPNCHFVSNIDPAHIADILKRCHPETTLILVASKTFTTIETMTNAKVARDWLVAGVAEKEIGMHLAALSSAVDKAGEFGIPADRVFGFEDWVGGRYSMWGPIGLSMMLAIGPDDFHAFLSGAFEMDQHFKTAPLNQNMPFWLAAVGLWHRNICGYATRAVLPYEQRLLRLPAYLQQLDMESNGKSVKMDGHAVEHSTGPIVWGEPGTNGQHAFYQLIHQGTEVIPCEFLVGRHPHEENLRDLHKLLQANCLAQSEALMLGRGIDQARALMEAKGLEGAELDRQAAHRVFAGNRPSTTLVYDKLSPKVLGQIIALYEHRVFVEGVIWGINSFDQWGVELGKILATEMLELIEGADSSAKDGSTQGLLRAID